MNANIIRKKKNGGSVDSKKYETVIIFQNFVMGIGYYYYFLYFAMTMKTTAAAVEQPVARCTSQRVGRPATQPRHYWRLQKAEGTSRAARFLTLAPVFDFIELRIAVHKLSEREI